MISDSSMLIAFTRVGFGSNPAVEGPEAPGEIGLKFLRDVLSFGLVADWS